MQIGFHILMTIVGALFGSFLCCQARRLRARELNHQKFGPRSICLHCKHQLRWYENIPIFSWLIQRGKCRKCGQKIGLLEILSEIGTMLAMLIISTSIDIALASPLDWIIFAFTVLLTLSLCFLAIYDGAYGELPSLILTFSVICAIIIYVISCIQDSAFNLDALGGALLLGGLYLILYLVSKGKWVGDGDWILATTIGLALGSTWLSLIALFVANFSACIIMSPSAIKSKSHKIYFGPFLVLAFFIVFALGDFLVSPFSML